MANLKDMFAIYPTREVSMFSGREMVGRKKTMGDLREIEKLNANEECLMGLDERRGGVRKVRK